jgi:hypothetical protein
MSTANPNPPTFGLSGAFERMIDVATTSVQAVAFWTAALMPLVLVAGLFAGITQQLTAVGGALLVNVVCAVIGHGHSPN